MIIVDRPKLKFFLAGRPVQIDAAREYRKGRVYAVAKPGHRTSLSRALILDIHELDADRWRLTIRQSMGDTPRFLHVRLGGRQGDYTDRADLAAHGEPEALNPDDLKRYADTARWRDDLERRYTAHIARTAGRRPDGSVRPVCIMRH